MTDELQALQARVARLEAKEAVLSAFNRYLYCMDTGYGDDTVDCYTEDAILDVPNFPGVGGADLHFEGRAEIKPLYEPYTTGPKGVRGGHHASNIAVNVAHDLQTAEVTAYFMNTTECGVQGGRYEGTMRPCADGEWRWQRLAITSAWGFRAKEFETVSDPVGLEYSPFGGRHAAYTTP